MLHALLERDVVPDLVVGTSIGAINGAAVAADPTVAAAARLAEMWTGFDRSETFGGSVLGRLGTLARTRTHLHGNEGLRRLLTDALPVDSIEDLRVPFECVAASIETASERWFTSGPLVDAILASSAVPGILPPVEVAGEHFIDGGIVNSIPVGRAVGHGARRIYVMHVGRVDRPLEPPRCPNGLREVWRLLPEHQPIEVKLWHEPAEGSHTSTAPASTGCSSGGAGSMRGWPSGALRRRAERRRG